MGRHFIKGMALALAGGLALSVGTASAHKSAGEIPYRNLELAYTSLRSDETYDIPIVSGDKGIKKLKAAIDYLYKKSPFSVKQIERLRQKGNVYVVYEPSFPSDSAGTQSLTIAAFLPDYFDRSGKRADRRDFVTVVGRYGIKWTDAELAEVIVHELVGHGIQHLKGRIDTMRELDLECEARLYEEKFMQEARIDKSTRIAIQDRRALEDHFCLEFIQYLREQDPASAKLWDVLNPNVPKLLSAFERYLKATSVRNKKAVAVAKKNFEEDKGKAIAKLTTEAKAGDPYAQFDLGMIYVKGNAVAQDFSAGAKWLTMASEQDFPIAQFALAYLYGKGDGVPKDMQKATDLMIQAANSGHEGAIDFLKKNNIPY